MNRVLNGIDRIDIWKKLLSGKRVGVMTHAPAVDLNYSRSADILFQHADVRMFWGPEHGLDGVAQAGDAVDTATDSRTGLPVYSLFRSSGKTFAETVGGVDVVVCDFCDIGSRFYTYISSMSDAMIECAKQHVPFIVLDRPNPIGGIRCDGPLLKEGFSSFVGRFPIPVRHGMTLGEAARFFNERFDIHCELTVVPVSGWKRGMEFEELGRTWLNPSPNMPSADCARIYTGTCLIEGTNLSEGRGTTRPYEIIGAPFLDPFKLSNAFNAFRVPGVCTCPIRFRPTFNKYKDEACGGVQFILTDRKNAACFEAGIRFLDILRNEFTGFEFRENGVVFDQLIGSDLYRTGKITADELLEQSREECFEFQKGIREFLLYAE